MATEIKCSTCFYWKASEYGNGDGECRVDCPVPVLTPVGESALVGGKKGVAVLAFFPVTRGDIWCGRHSQRVRMDDL